jgi:predicted ABC-type ATPase
LPRSKECLEKFLKNMRRLADRESMRHVVTVRNETGDEAASISSVRRVGDKLVMEGKALGTMQMDMVLSAEDALRAVRMMFSWQGLSFIILLPFFAIRNKIAKKRKDHTE